MPHRVLIDLGKLKTPYSGLGQFSSRYGAHISRVRDDSLSWTFLTPKSQAGAFGRDWDYENLSLKRRYFPRLCTDYALWHAVHQDSAYLPGRVATPYILTIHDLNFLQEKRPGKARKRLDRLQKKVDRASAVTFVSDFTAAVANEHLSIRDVQQRVIYNGVDIDTEREASRPAFLPDGEFLFAIGLVLEKKNFHVLVEFVGQLPGLNLVIAGDTSDAYAERIRRMAAERNLSHRVILPGVISDDDRTYLYQNCEAFAFPSLAEGFGLPVVEAMRFGKPVFVSRATSLPEIGGEFAYYWDSFDPSKMKDVYLAKMSEYRDNRRVLSEHIKQHSLGYTWEKAVASYVALYREIVAQHY